MLLVNVHVVIAACLVMSAPIVVEGAAAHGTLTVSGQPTSGIPTIRAAAASSSDTPPTLFDTEESVVGVARQADGKWIFTTRSPADQFSLTRFTAAGSLDVSFGAGGHVILNQPRDEFVTDTSVADVALQSDGRILVGTSRTSVQPFIGHFYSTKVARYNIDGSPDSTFGAGGVVQLNGFLTLNAFALQSDGRILVAGSGQGERLLLGRDAIYDPTFAVARLNPDGSRDDGFGSSGTAKTNFGFGPDGEGAAAVLVTPDGKIVLAGTGSVTAPQTPRPDFAVVRFNSDGSLDGTFGAGGKVTTVFLSNRPSFLSSVAVQPDGKIVAAGACLVSADETDFAVARYFSNGQLDFTFGVGGTLTEDFSGGSDDVSAIVLDNDGRLTLAGSVANEGSGTDIGLARYDGDGRPDAAFGNAGKVMVDLGGVEAPLFLQKETNGLLLAGASSGGGFAYVWSLARVMTLTGNGPFGLAFGKVPTGSTSTRNLTIANLGNSTLTVSRIAYPQGFSGNWAGGRIAAGSVQNVVVSFAPTAPANYGGTITVTADQTSGTNTIAVSGSARPTFAGDFDGASRGDLGVYRPTSGEWFVLQSHSGYGYSNYLDLQWGLESDLPISGDFDGDGKGDLVVYRPSTGEWFLRYSSNAYSYQTWTSYQWGVPDDVPISADFDGDGKGDLVVYRPSTGEWFLRYSSNDYSYATWTRYEWGVPGDTPVAVDFDGDGQADLAVYRPSTGEWLIRFSSDQYSYASWASFQWGVEGDMPVAADFDGDGKTDLVVYRPSNGTWYVRYSSNGYSYATWTSYQWGLPDDTPISMDFDGDGRTDLVVYRPSTGEWFIRYSSSQHSYVNWTSYQWGIHGDIPLPGQR
jgi:uncharacterized delta-60 repeat protein